MTEKFDSPVKIITGVSLQDGKVIESSIEVEGFEVINVNDNLKDCVTAKLSFLHSSGYTDERILWNDATPITYSNIGVWEDSDIKNRILEIFTKQ